MSTPHRITSRALFLLLPVLLLLMFERPSRAFNDGDGDSLDDDLEMQLAQQFFPSLHFTSQENCSTPEPLIVLFRARLLSYQGVANPDYAAIHYVMLYDSDCGFNGHAGDDESFTVFLHNYGSGWEYQGISATAHWGVSGYEVQSTSGGSDLWVAENKHGNYAEFSKCGYGAAFDDCALYGAGRSYWLFNVGEPTSYLTNSLGSIYPPWALEYAWDGTNFLDAGVIRNQLFLTRYIRRTSPPEIDACYADCNTQFDRCMLNYWNNDQCYAEYFSCSNSCAYYIHWDE